ncbi:MAG: nucleotidyltransferase [Bacteroidetes bacterium]|nr:nucleotidyltransferase [Bacteroidota bacterium]MBS1648101.1 nucleotidyltransferase [Bacteroidota bacterium]
MQPTLVILAAGMASRYGSMKQVESFGMNGETIMEYSIYDAIRAGFGKVIFIIREEFVDTFKEKFEAKLKGKIEVDYVFQSIHSFAEAQYIHPDRKKPWGTGHAVLCCKGKINEPFAVINADDFYGKDAFEKAAYFLKNECNEKTYSIIGYHLVNTLSEHGSVSRGVCSVDANNNLTEINERTKIYRLEDGSIVYEDESDLHVLAGNGLVSMNYICFHPNVIDLCETLFYDFLKRNRNDPKAEFFIPFVTNHFIHSGKGRVKVVPTSAQWFGVTYKEDAPVVKASLHKLIKAGEYPERLW